MWTAGFAFSIGAAPAINTLYVCLVPVLTGVIDGTIRNYQSGANGLMIISNAGGEYTLSFSGMPDNTPAAGVKLIVYTTPYSGSSNFVTGWVRSQTFYPLDETQAKIGQWGGLSRSSDAAQAGFRTLGRVWSVAGGINNVPAPAITQNGTPGSTTYYYQVTALNAAGQTLGYAGAAGNGVAVTATGPATLGSINNNALSWTAIIGATGYTIWGWTGSAWGTLEINQSGTAYVDQTGTITTGSIPTANTTSGGSDGNSGTASGPFATIAHAISVAQPGDIIQMGAMWFCIGTGGVNVPDGVGLVGAGMDVTTIVSDALAAAGCIVRPASNAVASDFTVVGTAAYPGSTNHFQLPLGSTSLAAQLPVVGATIKRVKTVGDSDGLYIRQSSNLTQATVIDCVFIAKFDAANIYFSAMANNVIDLIDCRAVSLGQSTCSAGNIARALAVSQGIGSINVFGGVYSANGGAQTTYGVDLECMAEVNFHGANISGDSSSGNVFDVVANGGPVNLFGDSSYVPAKVSVAGGGVVLLVSAPMANTADSPNAQNAQLVTGETYAAVLAAQATLNTINTNTTSIPTVTQIAAGVWQTTVAGNFTVANSAGKSIFTGLAPGDPSGGLVKNNAPLAPSAFVVAGETSFNNVGQTTPLPTGGSGITGAAQGGTANTITLSSGDTAVNGAYVGQTIMLPATGQSALVIGYVSATKIATVLTPYANGVWLSNPTNGTVYVLSGALPSLAVTSTSVPTPIVTPG